MSQTVDPPGRLLVAHSGADLYLEALRRRFPALEVAVCRRAEELARVLDESEPEIVYSCVTADFPRLAHRPILDAPRLRWLHVGGSGYEHFAGWQDRAFDMTNGRGVLAGFQADTVIGAILALNQNLHLFEQQRARRLFAARTFAPLAGQRLLVVGAGAIGGEVAKRARALGLVTMAASRRAGPLPHFDVVHPLDDLEEVVGDADIVSLHLPLVDETRHLFDEAMLARLRDDALLVNTARGAILDEAALVRTLAHGRLRGVYLDVFEEEPLPPQSPLWSHEKVLLSPHCADQVADWPQRHAAFFMDNLERRLSGRPLRNLVRRAPPGR
ncbi:MAG: D-2-hydroxyacid dehydrogenase [Geminicoccaceae bacterium]|nr:D-2-hydroxyacid dehydrogenase [Geminicoccaceae bacterium]